MKARHNANVVGYYAGRGGYAIQRRSIRPHQVSKIKVTSV